MTARKHAVLDSQRVLAVAADGKLALDRKSGALQGSGYGNESRVHAIPALYRDRLDRIPDRRGLCLFQFLCQAAEHGACVGYLPLQLCPVARRLEIRFPEVFENSPSSSRKYCSDSSR